MPRKNKSVYKIYQINRFDVLIFLSIVLLAFGEYGDSLQAVRVLSIVSLPVTAVHVTSLMKKQSLCYMIYFFMLWYVYNIISFSWTPDRTQAAKELLYYAVHFNLVLLLICLGQKARFPILAIIVGWVTMITFLLPISLYELASDHHLSVVRLQSNVFSNGGEEFRRHYSAATFYNYNDFNSILVWSLPFILMGMFFSKKLIPKIFIVFVVLSVFYIIIINASRGSLVSALLITLTFSYYYSNKNLILFSSLVVLSLAGLIVTALYTNVFDTILFRTQGNSSRLIDAGSRSSIYSNAWYVVQESWGTGSGIGSIQETLRATKMSKYSAAHNLFLEVLVQYGLIIFLSFLYWVYYPLIRMLKNKNHNAIQFLCMAFIVSFAVNAVVSSTYLLRPAMWVTIACFYVVYDTAKETV